MRLVFPLLAAAALAAGCGAERETVASPPPLGSPRAASPVTRAPPPAAPDGRVRCRPVANGGFRLCARLAGQIRVREWIERRAGDGWKLVTRQPPHTSFRNMAVGHWEDAWLSPDGRTLLAQWYAECEVPSAFFVPADGGRPRSVTGGGWRRAPESTALGWLADGRARVRLGKSACGTSAPEPGVYAIDPGPGTLERLPD